MRSVIFLLLIGLSACSDAHKNVTVSSEQETKMKNGQLLNSEDLSSNEKSLSKIVSGINYSCHVISALEFLERKQEQIDETDLKELKKESILIFDFSIPSEMKSIFDSPRNTMNKDDLIQYLAGNIVNDLEVEQNGKNFIPTGALYEGIVGKGNSLRVFFYIKDLNINDKMIIRFYDRMFGSGIIKLTKNSSNNITV
jgi:hypothetical protein